VPGVATLTKAEAEGRNALPVLVRVTGDAWQAQPDLHHEVFGPLGILITVSDAAQMEAIARDLEGQLTCTLQMDAGDTSLARRLMPILERKAGRLLANGFPTGVEVCDAMVHGGPYPASTNFGATSVGTMAIRRFLRPVAYQNMPLALLPEDLKEG
jgi:2,5-dioxopentanoate dehydrogenase